MVFESLVVDLLNKYLGQYVKNLDASQLKIGIWGGSVVLKDLELKDTALDELDLPIRVVRGYLGKLILDIPWKNLYTESTVVEIEDLHLVAKPNFDIKYNEEKEERHKREKKQQQIANIEQARKLEDEKTKEKKKEESGSFAEKLATNVIKNLQISIKNIHVCYEDTISDINGPFSVGFTLESLTAHTTDQNFVPKVIKESVTIIHKLVKLDNLAFYWNSKDTFGSNLTTTEWLENSKKQIGTYTNKPKKAKYMLSPIVASKKMKINTKPGTNMDIPQLFLSLVFEELGIIIARSQYHGVIQLIDSFERMNRNQPFRKYRPNVPVTKNAKVWWKYCISSILEVDVKRRCKMWSWRHIKDHREMCTIYKRKYKEKLKNKNPLKSLLQELEEIEYLLNIASITIFRRLAETELMLEEKKKGSSKGGGFFSFFSKSKEKEKSATDKVEDLMGSDAKDRQKEMQKLYHAIGYSENDVITPYPKQYVALIVKSELQKLFISLIDDTMENEEPLSVINFSLDGIKMNINQRPSAKALKLCAKIKEMKLFGTPTPQEIPTMIKSMITEKEDDVLPLVDFVFETNPLHKPKIDQCVSAVCQPLEIIYNANTIDHVIDFFEPPEHVILQDLQEKAYSTFEDFKISSTAGLLYAMEQRTIMDINVDVSASHLIIPDKGSLNGCTDMLVIDFGSFQLQSDPSQLRILDPKDIDDISEVQSKAYDRFLMKLQNLQVLLCKDVDDLRSSKRGKYLFSHILHPIQFDGKLAKAILPQDPRLKQITVSGSLSSLFFSVSDNKVSRLIKLADSIPLPKTKDGNREEKTGFVQKTLSMISLTGNDNETIGVTIPVPSTSTMSEDGDEFQTPPETSFLKFTEEQEPEFESGVANQVKVELNFTLHQLKLAIGLTDNVSPHKEKGCLEFIIDDIATEVSLRRWDMFASANIGRLVLSEMSTGVDGKPFEILSTPKNAKMLNVSYRQCEFNESLNFGPSYFYSNEAQIRALHFKDEFQSTEQIVDIQLATLYIVLHQEALLNIMSLIYQVLEPLEKRESETTAKLKKSISMAGSRLSLSIEEKAKSLQRKPVSNSKKAANELKEKVGVGDEKKMRLNASMDGVGVFICSTKVDLAQAYVKGLSANVLMKNDILEVKASMKDMQVQDNVGITNYKDIVSMQSDQVFHLELALYEGGSAGSNMYDMSSVDTNIKLCFGQMKVVFLYRFIVDLLTFVENFDDAKNAVIKAGKAATNKALEAAADINKHSSRIKLNILLKAPTIVLPVGSNSELALLVDLGELRIFNVFKLLNDDKYHRKSVISDNMTVKLSSLKLMKALIKDGSQIMHQRSIIEPMSLEIVIVRNLTHSNHSIPDVCIRGKMPAITLSISEEDVSVVLKVIKGNFTEGEILTKSYTKKSNKSNQLELPQDRLASIHEEPDVPTSYLQTKLEFDLVKIDLMLYLKPPDMTFEDEFLPRSDDLLLSLFTIGNLILNGDIMSDRTMSLHAQLDTLILDDMRPTHEGGVKRMINYCPEPLIEEMEKKPNVEASNRMIDVKFQQSSSSDKFADVTLSNMLFIFNVEFIMVLVRTFQAALPLDDDIDKQSTVSTINSTLLVSGGSDDENDQSLESYIVSKEDERLPEIKFNLLVWNPQIVLLADVRDVKVNALFLTTEVNFYYYQTQDVQKMVGTVSNTAVLSTALRKEHRTDISTVLSLDSINLLSSAPINGKPHINVTVSLVKLNVSPKTIRTLSACSGYIASQPSEEDLNEARKALIKLWDITDFTTKKAWYLTHPPQHVLSAGSFVLSRTSTGEYVHGFLAKKDTVFTVFFYPEGQISHKASDLSSVVLDLSPFESELYIGSNVLAILSKEKGYRTGRIMQIWNSNEELISHEEAKPKGVYKYLVQFYEDCSENYFLNEELRIIPKTIKGAVPGIGACVYARFNDGYYYRGIVEVTTEYKIHVVFTEINEAIRHDIDDPSAVILNMTPQYNQVKKHFKVIASKGVGMKGYHPGKVTVLEGSKENRLYIIQFEDGTSNRVPITKLLLIPKAPYDALPEVGTYVYSRVARDAPLYEKGIVAEKNNLICIKHLNGRKIAHEIQNINFVVRNIVPLMSSLRIGLDVIAQADNDDQKMYLAVIKDVVRGERTNRYLIEFTDGSRKKLTPSRIRILSQYGGSITNQDLENTSSMRNEELLVQVDGISLRVEGYLGGVLTPMLKLDSKINVNVKSWSTQMSAEASLSVQANYYNENVAEWEPVIEPIVEKNRERAWQLTIDYSILDSGRNEIYTTNMLNKKPTSSLKIKSHDNLEVTLSKSCIGLLSTLSKVFGDAVESVDILPKALEEINPFTIENRLAKRVTVNLCSLLKGPDEGSSIELLTSAPVPLSYREDKRQNKTNEMLTIDLKVEGFHDIKSIVIKRQRTVIYDLVPLKLLSNGTVYSVVVQVKATDGQRIIIIRSPLQMKNHFPMPMEISFMTKENIPSKLTTIESESIYSFPLFLTYHSVFLIKPAGFGYGNCKDPISWSDIKGQRKKELLCTPPVEEADPFYIQLVFQEEMYTSVHGMLDCVPRFIMDIYPSILLHNYLPCDVKYKIKGMASVETLAGGSNWPLFTINAEQKPSIYMEIDDYCGKKWKGGLTLPSKLVESLNKQMSFFLMSEDEKRLDLGVYYLLDGALNITLYSPYWFLNKTGKTLFYQTGGVSNQQEHTEDNGKAHMLFVKGKNKKAKVKVKNSESWSSQFSLDTIGSGGSLECTAARGRVFEIGVNINLSYFGLTKIVTFTPLRMLSNHTIYTISMAEDDSDTAEWHTVQPNQNIPYWPTKLPLKNLYININGMDSVLFSPECGITLLLKFNNEVGGICVNYQEKDSSTVISFNPYFEGSAPVRIENNCKKIGIISYKQTGLVTSHVLTYGQSVLYTWDDPAKEQQLSCSVVEYDNTQTKIKLDTNDFGRMKIGDDAIYWVSFLDGLQRVLLFTDNFKSAYYACQEQIMKPLMDLEFSIESFGLSLVNVEKRMEISYLAIRQSPIVWEQYRKNRWKTLPILMCEALEQGYINYQGKLVSAKEKVLDKEVDFEKMFITKPEKVKIRRIYHSGIEIKYTISPNRMQVSASISSIQLDSHVPGSTFQTVLHMIEPPKSVSSENAPKPFLQLSLITRIGDKNIVNEVSYCHLLIQEMDVRVDKGFLLSLMELFNNESIRGTEKEQYNRDMSQISLKFEESAEFQAAKQDRYYILQDFHLSPLKIHVSFSMTGGHSVEEGAASVNSLHGNILSLLFQSVGVAFTEIQDVEFKLACYEVHKTLQSNNQLIDGIGKHYQNQAIKQLYVLVLGLDVLGNPYGLITGVGAGAKNFFYEPYQGLIQGPEEFAEGLAYGVKSLVGGTVGGVSGAVSKITGTVGKGLAALTMDDEYQQKRRENMSQRPTNIGEGLAKGGKGLVKGIFSGVTGIVTKPYEGAKTGGAQGFVKGIGKGLIGVVARPVGGVVDMASNTFDGIKSTTAGVRTVTLSRVTRVFHADKVLRSFNKYEADGNNVLMQCNKGEFAKSHYYIAHLYPVDKKNYLILTHVKILYVRQTDLMNEWEALWTISFNDFKGEPEVKDDKIKFNVHNAETRKSIFKKSIATHEIQCENKTVAEWFLIKIRDAKML